MNNKYLPIGTICTLHSNSKKMMVLGYNCPKFNGKIEIADYVGVPYPEGLLLPNQATTFQVKDIANVDFVGFVNQEYRAFRDLLEKNTATPSPYQFDANGVVIHDEQAESLSRLNSNRTYEFDENGIVTFDPAVELSQQVDNKPYQFDVHKDNPNQTDDNINKTGGSPYRFDANGVVTFDASATANSPYQFDANGIVISDMTEEIKTEYEARQPKYIFDNNGVVIEELA